MLVIWVTFMIKGLTHTQMYTKLLFLVNLTETEFISLKNTAALIKLCYKFSNFKIISVQKEVKYEQLFYLSF